MALPLAMTSARTEARRVCSCANSAAPRLVVAGSGLSVSRQFTNLHRATGFEDRVAVQVASSFIDVGCADANVSG